MNTSNVTLHWNKQQRNL